MLTDLPQEQLQVTSPIMFTPCIYSRVQQGAAKVP